MKVYIKDDDILAIIFNDDEERVRIANQMLAMLPRSGKKRIFCCYDEKLRSQEEINEILDKLELEIGN